MVPVSVAVPAYGNENSLRNTLEKICKCRPLPGEILLHFDGDWRPEKPVEVGLPVPVRIIASEINVGPGGGRHKLMHEARHDLVASFDDDSWPIDADYFAKAAAVMDLFPRAAVLSPTVHVRERPILPVSAEVAETVSFEGSASVTRRSIYLQLPGYVPVAKAYGVEEVDVALQAHAGGWQIIRCAWIRAWHDRPHGDDRHSIVPWICNEVLLAYLRYPFWFQPWGWFRSFRHVLTHSRRGRLLELLVSVGSTPRLCQQFSKFAERYRFRQIWNHHFGRKQNWVIEGGCGHLRAIARKCQGRVLYVQYTNPAGYPPLQHSSLELARRGWEVSFIGVSGRGSAQLDFPPSARVDVRRMEWCAPGWKQKLHYLGYVLWTGWKALRRRPDWIYCSDPLSALPGRVARCLSGARTVYHEHDSPAPPEATAGWTARFWHEQRASVVSGAELIVLPNAERLKAITEETGITGETVCVWNCPSIHEVVERPPKTKKGGTLRMVYHGSIVPERFPVEILKALAGCERDVAIRLIGYEVPGMLGYTMALQKAAKQLGVTDRFEYLGALSQRSELMAKTGECDVGLSLLTLNSDDINMRHMAGASNKPFDYLSQGLALIVPRDAEWERLFVDSGCARACEQGNVEELIQVFRWLADHREEVIAMGLRGRELVLGEWNYERQFSSIIDRMERAIVRDQ
jgi:glycosyltransferase involved in cell wall biosynthesis